MNIKALNHKLKRKYGDQVTAREEADRIVVSGCLSGWHEAVAACGMCVQKAKAVCRGRPVAVKHVVNDITTAGQSPQPMRLPAVRDDTLEGARPDVLIIGGGISGASIARELTKWKLDVLLVEKEHDLACQASGRNDGEVHPGVDLGKGSLKQHYVLRGNRLYPQVCRELDVPFDRCGQYVGFVDGWLRPLIGLYAWQRRHICGVSDTRVISGKQLRAAEPGLNPAFRFAMYNESAGCVCPYGLTIAYGENAVKNGAKVFLNTAVLDMKVEGGEIKSVLTNRGRIFPAFVINAAGTFAEDVARMADDRFYSIHPRRGTNSILDKKAGGLLRSISSIKRLKSTQGHTKGGGILHTVDHNILVGPDAEETPDKEDFSTRRESIEQVFAKQKATAPALKQGDIITYFTGVRAATFEEDFIIEMGRRTKNLLHCAGIQSPGLTAAPAIALDVAEMTVKALKKNRPVEPNPAFDPHRTAPPRVRELDAAQRDELIKKNPDYGVIVCRCEEISKGEILDALHSPLPVATVDGIKKRLRPGMGRCQGGFCMPLVAKLISEHEKIPLSRVYKAGEAAFISFGATKGEEQAP